MEYIPVRVDPDLAYQAVPVRIEGDVMWVSPAIHDLWLNGDTGEVSSLFKSIKLDMIEVQNGRDRETDE